MYRKGKKGKLDRLFSLYIRQRDNWTCQRCRTKYKPKHKGYHCAHMQGRGRLSVAWDEENCYGLCYGCHKFLDQNNLEKTEWLKKRIGEKKYDALVLRANQIRKWKEWELDEMIEKYRELIMAHPDFRKNMLELSI